MEGSEKRDSGGSPRKAPSSEEIEEGIKSTKTVTWDPFAVLPKEIYLEIFANLENPVDKENFSNAHIKWYELFKSQRILFLSQQVFKVIGREKVKEEDSLDDPQPNDFARHLENLNESRLVCKDWDKAVQNYFQCHENHFILKDDDEDIILMEPCKSVTWTGAKELEKDLTMYSVTHPPSKNPIFSRSVTLSPFPSRSREGLRRRRAVNNLMERYGRHIWHCKFQIERKLTPEILREIAKWVGLMPGLMTLKLKADKDVEFYDDDLKQIEDVEVPQPELNKVVLLKSSHLPSVVFNKLFGNLPELKKIQIKISKGKGTLRDFVLPTDRKNLHEADLTLKGLEVFKSSRNWAFPKPKVTEDYFGIRDKPRE